MPVHLPIPILHAHKAALEKSQTDILKPEITEHQLFGFICAGFEIYVRGI